MYRTNVLGLFFVGAALVTWSCGVMPHPSEEASCVGGYITCYTAPTKNCPVVNAAPFSCPVDGICGINTKTGNFDCHAAGVVNNAVTTFEEGPCRSVNQGVMSCTPSTAQCREFQPCAPQCWTVNIIPECLSSGQPTTVNDGVNRVNLSGGACVVT